MDPWSTTEQPSRAASVLHSDLEHDSEPEDTQASAVRQSSHRNVHLPQSEENIGPAEEDSTANHGEVDPRVSDPADAPVQASGAFFETAPTSSRDEPVWPFTPRFLNAEYDDPDSGCEWLRCTRVEIDLYDQTHPATYTPDNWDEDVKWKQPQPNWDAAIPPEATTTLDDTWLSIYPQQYTRKLRDKHAFIGFPWEHHYYHIGECQNRQCGFVFRHRDEMLRRRPTLPTAEVESRRMLQFQAFLCSRVAALGQHPVPVNEDEHAYDADSLGAYRELSNIHLDLPQLKALNEDWIDAYEDWADHCPWKTEDPYFSKYQPFLVILKYGQNAQLNLSAEGWTELTAIWDRKYDMSRISRFTVALAVNPNGTIRDVKIFPLAFTKTACNIQSKTLPNFLEEEAKAINSQYATQAGVPIGQRTVVAGASYQLYACPKIKLRPTASTRTDLRLGRMTAALVGCGLSGSRAAAVTKLIRRIERKSPFARVADRLLSGNSLIGARSEPEFVLYPEQLPANERNATSVDESKHCGGYADQLPRGIVQILQRFLALYWHKTEEVRHGLLVFREGVWPKLMLSSAFMWNLAATRIWKDAMHQSGNGRYPVAWQLIEAMSICERNMILAQSGNQIIMDRQVYAASGMLERFRETGFPSTTEEFWACDNDSKKLSIDSSLWPTARNGATIPLLGWWAATRNWGMAAGEDYRQRVALQVAMDRLDGQARDGPILRRSLACRQVVNALINELRHHLFERGQQALRAEHRALEVSRSSDLNSARANLSANLRQQAALDEWNQNPQWGGKRAYKLLLRSFGVGPVATPSFPWNTPASMEIGVIVSLLLRQAREEAPMGSPLPSKHSGALAVLRSALPMLEPYHDQTKSSDFNMWMSKGLAAAFKSEGIEFLPWNPRNGFPSPKHWIRIDYVLQQSAIVTEEINREGEVINILSDPSDGSDMSEDDYIDNQWEEDMGSGQDWHAVDPMEPGFATILDSRRKLSVEMQSGIDRLCSGKGFTKVGRNFGAAFKLIAHRLESRIQDPVHQYFIFLTTVLAKVYPRFRYLAPPTSQQYSSAADMRKAQMELVIDNATLPKGQRDFAEKKLSLPLFCNLGLYHVIQPVAKLLTNGAKEAGNFRFKTREELLVDWRLHQALWQKGEHATVLLSLLGEQEVRRYISRGLLKDPTAMPQALESDDTVEELLDRRAASESRPSAKRMADTERMYLGTLREVENYYQEARPFIMHV
ncbi:hypothetical protein CALCODRAFT_538038 [Calocera cornea HHB12733]|uniref:Uncharacterized protein n=1 Tax=Calocera cornea HHB12733 TaxID=1353952 RepID=A0A165C1Y6_9BASI|nr:hypothetical protein CALCODRAFT_538038 [Calocera cornea HHB12733]